MRLFLAVSRWRRNARAAGFLASMRSAMAQSFSIKALDSPTLHWNELTAIDLSLERATLIPAPIVLA